HCGRLPEHRRPPSRPPRPPPRRALPGPLRLRLTRRAMSPPPVSGVRPRPWPGGTGLLGACADEGVGDEGRVGGLPCLERVAELFEPPVDGQTPGRRGGCDGGLVVAPGSVGC